MANVMYYAWVEHHMKPSEVYYMQHGEFEVIKAFYLMDMERRKDRR